MKSVLTAGGAYSVQMEVIDNLNSLLYFFIAVVVKVSTTPQYNTK